ncbi:hypothetical protein ZWY2020_005538, partial [Hordeum vulgare]
ICYALREVGVVTIIDGRKIDEGSNDGTDPFQPNNTYLPIIVEAIERLKEVVGEIKGATMENNKFCVSVHFREARREKKIHIALGHPFGSDNDLVKNIVMRTVDQEFPDLKVTNGKKVMPRNFRRCTNPPYAFLKIATIPTYYGIFITIPRYIAMQLPPFRLMTYDVTRILPLHDRKIASEMFQRRVWEDLRSTTVWCRWRGEVSSELLKWRRIMWLFG